MLVSKLLFCSGDISGLTREELDASKEEKKLQGRTVMSGRT